MTGEPPRSEEPEGGGQSSRKRVRGTLEFVATILVAFALVFGFIRPFVIQSFYVSSGSMIPTLRVDDRVLVNKFIYDFTEPERGDVALFESVGTDDDVLIKRVVGLPGDTLEVRNGNLLVNGRRKKEPYLNKKLPDYSSFGQIKVSRNRVFAMDDNRASSGDSRTFGPVPERNLIGEAFLRFWPPSRLAAL